MDAGETPPQKIVGAAITYSQQPQIRDATYENTDQSVPTIKVQRVLGPVRHETFAETRHLSVDPGAVFCAFADPNRWHRWFKLPGTDAIYEHDFRVGGVDRARSTFRHLDGTEERLEYRSRYIHLIKDEQIAFSYESLVDDVLCWTSLVSVQLDAEREGTRLTWTEQVAYFVSTGDGSVDLPHLRGALRLRLNGLPGALVAPT